MAKAADIAGRLGHAARAAVKTAWFGAHYVAARRASGPLARPDEAPFRLTRKLPAPAVLLADIRRLVAADRLNVERGFYPPPEGPPLDLGAALGMSRRFLDDAREVARRRRAGAHPGAPIRRQVSSAVNELSYENVSSAPRHRSSFWSSRTCRSP